MPRCIAGTLRRAPYTAQSVNKVPFLNRGRRSKQVSRAVQTRSSSSSVMTISYVATDPPRCSGVATPVTRPDWRRR